MGDSIEREPGGGQSLFQLSFVGSAQNVSRRVAVKAKRAEYV